jgi:hypothetical protein
VLEDSGVTIPPMTPQQLNPHQKDLLSRALQVQIDQHRTQGNVHLVIDLILSPKDVQERFIRDLARTVTTDLMGGVEQMQSILASAPVVPLAADLPPPVQPPAPPSPSEATEAVALHT